MKSFRKRGQDLFNGRGSQREERLRLLASASQALAASFDLAVPLQQVARMAVPQMGDVALIDVLGSQGELERAAMAFVGSSNQALATSAECSNELLNRRVLTSGRPLMIGRMTARAASETGGTRARSLLLVPLLSTKGALGVLTLVASTSRRRFTATDLAVAQDLAGRIGTAVERAQLYDEAKRAIQARQDVLAFVSHDLKNSLMSLFLNVELLQRSVSEDEHQLGDKQIDRLRRGIHQMRRMIEDLLDAGSIESGRLAIDSREHELSELFQEVVELSASLIHDKRIEIKLELPVGPCRVRCDRDRMMQVFSNLIGNAVKFVPEGGRIGLSAKISGTNALVSVRDTGPGIPAARLPHLFQRYWQADETARKGRGLGLFISKGIVEAQGGLIWAESQVGVGSTFFMTLPLAGPAAGRAMIVEGEKRPPKRSPPRDAIRAKGRLLAE